MNDRPILFTDAVARARAGSKTLMHRVVKQVVGPACRSKITATALPTFRGTMATVPVPPCTSIAKTLGCPSRER